MALTTAQTLALFEILEVPYATSYNSLSGVGSLARSFETSATGQTAAKTAIESRLSEISATPDLEALLASDLDEWNNIRLKVAQIQSGGVGDLQGASYSYEDKRTLIRERVKVVVPFYRAHEILAKQQGESSSVPIFR